MIKNNYCWMYLLPGFCFFLSCNLRSGVEVSITNKRDSLVRSIVISPGSPSLTFNNLKPGETHKGFLNFRDVAKVDGAYGVQINGSADSINNFVFGYYSNGSPSEKEIHLKLYQDSTGIQYIYKDY